MESNTADPNSQGGSQPPSDSEGREKNIDNIRNGSLAIKSFVGLEIIGLLVFFLSGIAIIFYTLTETQSQTNSDTAFLVYTKDIENLLTLAAISLIVTLIGNARSLATLSFGLFLIGALVVPSKDLVRYALIAFGSEENYESFFSGSSPSADWAGRSTDVAGNILLEMKRRGVVVADQDKFIRDLIVKELQKERIISLSELVAFRGALLTLRTLNDDPNGLSFRYGTSDSFVDDLNFLRSEGLIEYGYDDLRSARVTNLGRAVLLISRDSGIEDVAREIITSRTSSSSSRLSGISLSDLLSDIERNNTQESAACPPDINAIPDRYSELIRPSGVLVRLSYDQTYIRMVIGVELSLSVTLDRMDAENSVDPVLTIYSVSENSECSLLIQDDDSGGNLNSKIDFNFDSGVYIIEVASIGSSGDAILKVSPL